MFVVSVFGPFASRALVEMSTDQAGELFDGEPLAAQRHTNVIDAVVRDVEAIRERAPELADSGLAAAAVALAYELEHPYNSATSKAACAKELREAMDRLRELTPPKETRDGIDGLGGRATLKLAGGTKSANSSRS